MVSGRCLNPCDHLWIEGPELPRTYGSELSRICTECGVYQIYDWYGYHRRYEYYVDADYEWELAYENR